MDPRAYRTTQPTTKELRDYVKNGQENFFAEMEAGFQRVFCRSTKNFYLRSQEETERSNVCTTENRKRKCGA